MMTSPSEEPYDQTALPVRLFHHEPGNRRQVSRLEFHSVKEAPEKVTARTEQRSESTETELRLKNEMAALDLKLNSQAEQIPLQMEAVRIEARTEARREWEDELENKIAMERELVSRTCEQFGRERAKYFADIEAEVVKLALAIAARVLHREVKLDQLLLAAGVRIALGKVADDSATVLRVPVEDVTRWQEVFVAEPSVQVVGDERLAAGDCVLDTNVGKVELGVNAQLSEIETGFLDLLQQRPA
jgi:flagellar assembly protein FliH